MLGRVTLGCDSMRGSMIEIGATWPPIPSNKLHSLKLRVSRLDPWDPKAVLVVLELVRSRLAALAASLFVGLPYGY